MYRSLCDRGSLIEYVYVLLVLIDDARFVNLPISTVLLSLPSLRSPDPTQFSSKAPSPTAQSGGANDNNSMRFASATQSEGTRTACETPVFLPADQIYTEFVPGVEIPSLTLENTKNRTDSAGYNGV